MKTHLQKAKSELESLGESILNQIPSVNSNNPIENLTNQMKRLQSFIDEFGKRAADKINEIVDSHKSDFSENELADFQDNLAEHVKSLIFIFRDRIL